MHSSKASWPLNKTDTFKMLQLYAYTKEKYLTLKFHYAIKIKPKTRGLHSYWVFSLYPFPFQLTVNSVSFIISVSVKYESRNTIHQFWNGWQFGWERVCWCVQNGFWFLTPGMVIISIDYMSRATCYWLTDFLNKP